MVAPYLTLMTEAAPQREHSLRAVLKGVRWIVRTGAAGRRLPPALPPWEAVYQRSPRWLKARVFAAIGEDLGVVLCIGQGREGQPSAAILDSRPLQSSSESGQRAGSEGAKRRRGSKVHIAVDTLGQLVALRVTAATEQGPGAREGVGDRGPGGDWREG